MLLILKDLIT